MTVQEILPLVLQGSLLLLVFALGLTATLADATYLFRRPGQLLRSVAAINVAVPLVAALLVAMLPLAPVVKLAIVLMAVSPLPPVIPENSSSWAGRGHTSAACTSPSRCSPSSSCRSPWRS